MTDEGIFHKGNTEDGNHYWLSPKSLWDKVVSLLGAKSKDEVYDPVPYPRPDGYDGLEAEWGKMNYVNPPFASVRENGKRIGMTAWVRKAIAEQKKGNTTVLVYPQYGWVHELAQAGAEFVSLGKIRWEATEDTSVTSDGSSSPIMAFVLRGDKDDRAEKINEVWRENSVENSSERGIL